MAKTKSNAASGLSRKQYAERAREKAIKQLMSYGYDRKTSEEAFDRGTERYKKEFKTVDEYSSIIRHANESLYDCGMLDRVLTDDDLIKLGKKKPTKAKSAPKPTKKPKYRRAKPAKVYKNKDGKLVYKQSTDKVGDVLVNQAGVKYTITGERFHAPTGYDDGKLKVRVLQVKTSAGQTFEISDGEMEHYRQKNVLTREKKSKPTATKKTEKANPVVQSKAAVQPKAAKTPAQKKTTYTVCGKTFATLAEAKAYKAAQKVKAGKPCEIKEGTRKPSHKIVSFTAKSK